MQNNINKIIAREFLFFLAVLVIGLLSFSGGTLYNFYNKTRISDLQMEIDTLSRRYNDKIGRQFWLTNNLCEKAIYDCGAENNRVRANNVIWGKLIKYASEDKLKFKMGTATSEKTEVWNAVTISVFNELGFSTPEQLKKFVSQSSTNKKEVDEYKRSMQLEENKNKISYKILEDYQLKNLTLNATAISFLIGFVVRYFFIAILWSIKILKS